MLGKLFPSHFFRFAVEPKSDERSGYNLRLQFLKRGERTFSAKISRLSMRTIVKAFIVLEKAPAGF